jgi:hypothetical protein
LCRKQDRRGVSCRPWPAVLASYYLPVSAPRPDRGSKSHAQILMSGEFDPPRHACYRWTRAPTSTHASAWVHASLKHGKRLPWDLEPHPAPDWQRCCRQLTHRFRCRHLPPRIATGMMTLTSTCGTTRNKFARAHTRPATLSPAPTHAPHTSLIN